MPVKQTLHLPFTPDEIVREMVLVRFGSTKYDKNLFNQVTNSDLWCKPNGGLWCAVDGSAYSWDTWCRNNEFNISTLKKSFKVKFESGAKVVRIDSYTDLLCLPEKSFHIPHLHLVCFDFEQLVSAGVDAVYLTEKGEALTRYTEPHNLYGWDCECVLVLNADSIYQV